MPYPPCGTFNETYEKDTAIFRTKAHWVWLVSAILFFLAFPFFANEYLLSVTILIYIYIIAAHGLNLLTGFTGLISIAHSAFIGIGAYASAILVSNIGFPFWLAFPCSIVITGLIGVIFGAPSLRLKGFYLVMATLAAQFIINFVIMRWKVLTGGVYGMSVPSLTLSNMEFDTNQSFYYIAFIVLVLSTYVAKNLVRTQVGRAFIAIRDNDLAAEVMGINLTKYKLLSFAAGCAFAGAAGSLWGHWVRMISPEHFNLMGSVWFLGYIIVGGLGSILGPFFGVIFITLTMEILSSIFTGLSMSYPEVIGYLFASREIFFGLILALFLIFEPRGLAHRWEIIKASYRLYPFSY